MKLSTTQTQALAWSGIAVLLVLALWGLAPVLLPFVLAGVLAYVLHPLVERLASSARWRMPRLAAVLLVETLALLVALALLLLIVPVVLHGVAQVRDQLPTLAGQLSERFAPWLQRLGWSVNFDPDYWQELAREHLGANSQQVLGALLASARVGGSFVMAVVGYAVLVPMLLYYLLSDWSRIWEQARALVPPRLQDSVASFLTDVDAVLGQYLRGQLLVMAILAAYYSTGLALFGFDLALPVGVFTGLASFIPFVGFGLGLALALFAGLLEFGVFYTLVAVAVVYGIGQLVESVYLTPRLVGDRIGLHPVAVVFALLAFGHLFGFVGVLLALPMGAIALVALQRMRAAYVGSGLYSG